MLAQEHEATEGYRLRRVRFSNGERYALVVDRRTGLPLALSNQWALSRRPQLQANTLISQLHIIAYVHDWAARRHVDLLQRLRTGNSLQPGEIKALFQNLRYSIEFARKASDRVLTDVENSVIVSSGTHAARVAVARDYLKWALERVLYRLDVSDMRAPAIRERIDLLDRLAREFTLGRHAATSPKGLDAQQRARLLEIVSPTSKINPFLRHVRFRNWTLILMLLAFGFRRGETLKLYVSDVNVKGREPTLRIVRRPGDPNDLRVEEPAVKTLGRLVPLTRDLAEVLNSYLLYHRPSFPKADTSPFLFFSRNGKPLSIRMVNAVFERVQKKNREFAGLLTPHVLRHTFNDMFVESAMENHVQPEALKQAQNYLNGWNINSEQGALYSRRAIEKSAAAISLEHQRKLFL